MALSTTANYSLRKHDAGDLNWDVDVNWNMTEIDKKLKLLFANFLTCSTAIGTVAKTAAFSNFVLETGCLVAVKFVNGNSASEPTLDVNSTGAKAIQVNGAAVAVGAIIPNGVYLLVYDGANWAILNPASVSDVITDGETGLAPTQNAVFDALALKTDSSDVAVTAAANKIPKADALGKIDLGYLPAATLPDIALGDAGKVLSVNSTENGLEYTELPLASTTVKGVVKVGNSLSSASGVLSVVPASTTVKGAVELATSAEVFAGTDDERAVTSKGLDYSYATLAADRIYEGVNLETKFASEIAGYANVWAWIKARITAVNYKGLHIGDYVLFTMGSDTVQAQIAGIDTNYRLGNPEIGHHIDFISKDCMSATYQWNTTDNNNGNETNAAPYMVSALKASLDGLVTSLPAGLQTVVIPKKFYLETRYASGATLTDSTGLAVNDIGKLWVPNEYEVYGSTLLATPYYSVGSCAQYPIFASLKSRKKGAGHNGAITNWWLANPQSGFSTRCCFTLSFTTTTSSTGASTLLRVPLCFRIG